MLLLSFFFHKQGPEVTEGFKESFAYSAISNKTATVCRHPPSAPALHAQNAECIAGPIESNTIQPL